MSFTDFDKRMKRYELSSRQYLTRRTPVLIRIDGKAFHTFTHGMARPFDMVITQSMQNTMKYLCENIQGCVLGFTQSDEITLLLVDFQTVESEAWFDYKVDKICSVSSSMATLEFNKSFARNSEVYRKACNSRDDAIGTIYERALSKGALFDSRCFNVPINDVCNAFIWRQKDAMRNSVRQVGHEYIGKKKLHKVSTKDTVEKLLSYGVFYDDFATELRRGSCCYKGDEGKFFIDKEIPEFTEDRNFIERWLQYED